MVTIDISRSLVRLRLRGLFVKWDTSCADKMCVGVRTRVDYVHWESVFALHLHKGSCFRANQRSCSKRVLKVRGCTSNGRAHAYHALGTGIDTLFLQLFVRDLTSSVEKELP